MCLYELCLSVWHNFDEKRNGLQRIKSLFTFTQEVYKYYGHVTVHVTIIEYGLVLLIYWAQAEWPFINASRFVIDVPTIILNKTIWEKNKFAVHKTTFTVKK